VEWWSDGVVEWWSAGSMDWWIGGFKDDGCWVMENRLEGTRQPMVWLTAWLQVKG